jgi:hypothetical protein
MRVLAPMPHFHPFSLTPHGIQTMRKEKKATVEQPPLDLSKLPTDCLRLIAKFLQIPAAAAVSECTFKFFARTPIREAQMLRISQGAFILSPLYHKRGSRESGVY